MPPPDRPLRDAPMIPADSIAEGMARDVSPYARSLLDELRANQNAMAETMRVPSSLMRPETESTPGQSPRGLDTSEASVPVPVDRFTPTGRNRVTNVTVVQNFATAFQRAGAQAGAYMEEMSRALTQASEAYLRAHVDRYAMGVAPAMPPPPPKRAPAPEKMQPGAPLKRRRSVKVDDDGE